MKIIFPKASCKVFELETTIQVCYLNYGNHLGHDSFFTILQEARMQWLKSLNSTSSEIRIENNIGWLVSSATASYTAVGNHGDNLLIEIFLDRSAASKASFLLHYRVINKTTLSQLGKAVTKQVFFNYQSNKVAVIPRVLKKFLK